MNKTLNRLNQLIETVRATGRSQDVIDLINDLLYLMSQNCNLSPIAGNIIKLLPTPNVLLKKVICSFLIRYSESISDLGILTSNSLRKDFADPNPQVRKLVIKTTCSIIYLKDLALELLPKALQDKSVLVRQTATAFCPKIITINIPESSEIIDRLYGMVRDDDPLVVSNSLMSLEEVLHSEGGIVVNYKMARYLLSRMTSFPEWAISPVCEILMKYKVRNEDEALEFLNILDGLLNSKNSVVITSVMGLTFLLIQTFHQNLEKDILQRIEDSLFIILSNCSPEMSNVVIEHIENIIPKYTDIFSKHYKLFFCHYKDPICLKIKKLKILSLIVQNSNYCDIIENVTAHLTNCEPVAKQAISTFIEILHFNEDIPQHHIDILLQLLTTHDECLFEQIIISLSSFDLDKFDLQKELLFSAILGHYFNIFSAEGINAILTIICNYGKSIDNAPYILEKIISESETVFNNEVLYNFLLITSLKLFLSHPAEMQLILGKVLQEAMNSKFIIVKAQAAFYNSLLQTDLHVMSHIINCQLINKV